MRLLLSLIAPALFLSACVKDTGMEDQPATAEQFYYYAEGLAAPAGYLCQIEPSSPGIKERAEAAHAEYLKALKVAKGDAEVASVAVMTQVAEEQGDRLRRDFACSPKPKT